MGGEATGESIPGWLKRALNPTSPMLDNKHTVQTIDVDIGNTSYVVPTIRVIDGKLKRLRPSEAIKMAEDKGDLLKVPEGMSGEEFSKVLSDLINESRRVKKSGGGILNALKRRAA